MENLHADFAQRVVIDTESMDWQPSPSPSVWRKRLDLVGGEFGRVTSVVRYDPHSTFHSHDHPDGEEILVLEGTFADEHGVYPAGTYLLNPPGFRHAPRSAEGCVLFVKLRQYGGVGRVQVAIDTNQCAWTPSVPSGVLIKTLYQQPGHSERMRLERWQPGALAEAHAHPGGEEIFVLSGAWQDEHGRYGPSTWVRNPPGSRHTASSPGGCTLYVKTGGLL